MILYYDNRAGDNQTGSLDNNIIDHTKITNYFLRYEIYFVRFGVYIDYL